MPAMNLPQVAGETIAVIVPCHNSRGTLDRLLSHLRDTHALPLPAVIVVDDGSSDGTSEMLRQRYAEVPVLAGDGGLLWTGAIRLGMEAAMINGATRIFWLNHDCRPDAGAFERIVKTLDDPHVGCVSGWCRIVGHPDHPVNPGFRKLRPLDIKAPAPQLVGADGVNGNFVGFRADVIRKIGLPDARRHPHYGDGPFTIRVSRAGFRVLVRTDARADLDFELLRRMPPFWRVALGNESAAWWLRYFFLSFKSQYHLRNRWNDSVVFRGRRALLSYPKVELTALLQILAGALVRHVRRRPALVRAAVARFSKQWPAEKLRRELSE
jgi:glycosyltransferase involved in cell wall biosynthesis